MMQKRFEKVAKLYRIYSNSSCTLNSRHPRIIAARSASAKKKEPPSNSSRTEERAKLIVAVASIRVNTVYISRVV